MAISVGGAIGAGFNLVARRPMAVFAWGLLVNVGVFVLVALMIGVVGMSMFGAFAHYTPGSPPSEAEAMQMLNAIWPIFLVLMVGSLFINAVVQAAVIRSVLRPEDRGFASIRIGVEEGVMVLLYLVYFLFFILAYIAFFIVVIACGILSKAVGGFLGGTLAFLITTASVFGLFWIGTRFALAGPMSFADRRVRFFAAWELTRGEGWRLYGLAWLIFLIALGMFIAYYIVSTIISLVVLGAGAVSLGALAGAPGSAQNPAALMAMWPVLLIWFLFTLALGSAFTGLISAVAQAPWAEAYRQLKGSPDVAATFS